METDSGIGGETKTVRRDQRCLEGSLKGIILAAGRGKRLLPYTQHVPKCLVEVGGQTILEHQISRLTDCGIRSICVVTGHGSQRVAPYGRDGIVFRFNPFYSITNNIASLWFAVDFMSSGFVVLNSDVMFDIGILADLLKHPGDIVLAVERKRCDLEDMRVRVNSNRIVEISKKIELAKSFGEFTGLVKVSERKSPAFVQALEEMMRTEQYTTWFDMIFQKLIDWGHEVSLVETGDKKWIEIDFPQDLVRAREMFDA